MPSANEVYQVVYEAVRREAQRPDSAVIDQHREFALALPSPASVTDLDAAALCSLVVACGEWGLEGFYGVSVEGSGQPLGEFVREALPTWEEYQERARELVEQYRPH